MAVMLGTVARRDHGASPAAAVLIGALILLAPQTSALCLVGLETVVYACVLLVAFHRAAVFLRAPSQRHCVVLAAWIFAAMLLRPEAALLYVVVASCSVAGPSRGSTSSRDGIRSLLPGTLVLLAAGGAYLSWKWLYFGQLLPNPFYLKAASTRFAFTERGSASVTTFLGSNVLLLTTCVVGLGTARFTEVAHRRAIIAGVLLLAATALFFARSETLMDIEGRFMYPMLPILIYCAIHPLVAVLGRVEARRPGKLSLCATTLVCLLVFGTAPVLGMGDNLRKIAAGPAPGASDPLMQKELRIARSLARFPEIEQVRIAFADSGVLPYFSGAIWLDTVGLNDSFIARTRDRRAIVDHYFRWRPDLALLPSNADFSWIRYGHGPIGDVTAWAHDPRWDDFDYVGTSLTDGRIYDLQYFVRKDSRFAPALTAYLRQHVVDGWYAPLPFEIGSRRANPSAPPTWNAAPHGAATPSAR